ncbi:bacillithiol biosynthesis cysteine-adding enzyme BshC [Flavobacterium sp.]|jgi:bacillithiol biosynthesis cysteine-adding enzyme BshC|uniref:bacillithiol biosynthesis cysteine-adding enzyme BshC n=1 Tax=Flavobacterium sp. TaxID=239 RepID=UPI002A836D2D|nr:bacillithiol biosynthesis cysteine-adding enzyme BshC [Flavobacterium sp.]
MPNDCITYQNSSYFSNLIVDYLNEKEELKPLYNRFPTLENFKLQIEEKQQNFSLDIRTILVDALKEQYQNIEPSDKTTSNIEKLLEEKTFTITTGHQLNLFTGPLYFLYKIVSVINLTKELKAKYPEYNFVPIYWMATEDHDFEEINYFNFNNKKIKWNKESNGPVGRLSTGGLDTVFEEFSAALGKGENADYLRELFKSSYLNHNTLTEATRYLTNELFKDQGLVIIDGDHKELKKSFAPLVKNELLNQTSFSEVNKTNKLLEEYKIQVNPREINLFYILDDLRERIIFENNFYTINNTNLKFSISEILTELENYPERFSPNVILRPLYQEAILPNLCYIGGGGELAYWFELKSNFEVNNVTFPILLLRNSVLIATEKQIKKADKLNLSWAELFLNQENLIEKKTKELSQFKIDFTEQKLHLSKQFQYLTEIAKKTDKSFIGAVKAQEAKQNKGLDNLEKRLLKAEKKKHSEKITQITQLQNELFPNKSLQERNKNLSEFVKIENYPSFLEKLLQKTDPLQQKFTIIEI